jgi:hypothetical protein
MHVKSVVVVIDNSSFNDLILNQFANIKYRSFKETKKNKRPSLLRRPFIKNIWLCIICSVLKYP